MYILPSLIVTSSVLDAQHSCCCSKLSYGLHHTSAHPIMTTRTTFSGTNQLKPLISYQSFDKPESHCETLKAQSTKPGKPSKS